MNNNNDYYNMFGLNQSSSQEDIRKAINKKLRKIQSHINHPDNNIRKKANTEMELLIEARKVLLEAEEREKYDKAIEKNRPPVLVDTPRKQPLTLIQPALNHSITLLLDTSGSMCGEKIMDAKDALNSFVQTVDFSQNEIALVAFGKQISWMDKLTQNNDFLCKEIDGLKAGGETPMMHAIQAAHEKVLKKGRARPVMVIATDGIPTDSAEEEILEYTAPIKKSGTWIITIGIGDNVNEEFLEKLASSPEDYHFAKASFELKEIYKNVVSGLVTRKRIAKDE